MPEPSPAGSPSLPSEPSTVLVTGSSRGIGRAVALEFGVAGWRVVVHYRERKEEAAATVSAIEASGGEAICYQADIRDEGQVTTMVEAAIDLWGTLDAMICNAGIASSRLLLRLHPEEWTTVLDTNLTGTFHCLKAAGRHMLTRQEGTVIVIGSSAAVQGRSGQAAYAASKAGLLGLVKTAAREWGANNIRVNAIFPGRHRTDLSSPSWDDDDRLDDHLLGRTPNLQAVARSVYHLTLQRDISGQVWNLDSRIL